jgi:hypothetical protein
MADLLPSLSSDDEDGKIGNNYDDEEDDENEEVDVVFGGLLVSLERVKKKFVLLRGCRYRCNRQYEHKTIY